MQRLSHFTRTEHLTHTRRPDLSLWYVTDLLGKFAIFWYYTKIVRYERFSALANPNPQKYPVNNVSLVPRTRTRSLGRLVH